MTTLSGKRCYLYLLTPPNYYSDLNQLSAYADYVNPAAVYLDGLFFMTQATGNSDLERSRNSFERGRSMIGENKFIQQDLETVQQVINGQQIPATTYVFFETGQSLLREQIRIDLPLFLITPSVPYTGAAFPKLKYRSDYISALNISYSGKPEAALLLSNMDAVVAHEFKNEMPTIITKTLIASAMNQADLRTWTSLPKEFHFCRFPTPADRKIELESPFSGYKLPVSINDGLINVVWVKSVNRGSPLLVSQFKLKDETKGAAILPSPETTSPKEVPQREPAKPEQPQQLQQPEASKSEQAAQQSQPEATGQVQQPIQGTQTESSKLEHTVPSSQPESSTPEQSTQMPQQETSIPDEATQEDKPETSTEQSVLPLQPEPSKSESSTQESKPDISKPKETTQSENTQSSNLQELPLETALRFERERILAMGDAKVQQIDTLKKEGLLYMNKGDWKSAIATYNKLLEIDPGNFWANECIGEAYIVLREFDLAIKCLTQANQLIPTHPLPYANFMYIYAMQGDIERAMEFLKEAVDKGFKDVNYLKNDTDLPENFKNDPRFIEITKHLE